MGSQGQPASPQRERRYCGNVRATAEAATSGLKSGDGRWGDRIFHSLAVAAGATIIGAIALMGLFLFIRALPSLQVNKANFFTSSEFITTDPGNLRFGIAELFQVTVLSSVFALVIAVPIAIGIAAFLTNYAPRRLAKPFAMLVDLLAAVPSIVFGLWGIFVLAPLAGSDRAIPQRQSWGGSSCSPTATSRSPAAAPSSPRGSCSR